MSDGHGSTRQLVDATGQPLAGQVYAYDAFGNRLDSNSALTTFLYSGEVTDALTGLQYLRARYYNPATGTFNRLDPFAGNPSDPQGLHKYLYAYSDPIHFVDPTGFVGSLFGDSDFGQAAHRAITRIYQLDHPFDDTSGSGRWTRIGSKPGKYAIAPLYRAKVDLLNKTTKRYAEIKPLSLSGIASGGVQLALREGQFARTGYQLDTGWTPSTHVTTAGSQAIAFANVAGLVLYTDRTDLLEDVLAISTIQAARVFYARFGTQSLLGVLGRVPQLASVRVSFDSARLNSAVSIGGLIAVLGGI